MGTGTGLREQGTWGMLPRLDPLEVMMYVARGWPDRLQGGGAYAMGELGVPEAQRSLEAGWVWYSVRR